MAHTYKEFDYISPVKSKVAFAIFQLCNKVNYLNGSYLIEILVLEFEEAKSIVTY